MKVPIIMQMHSGENGAAALAMILSYYKKHLPMKDIRDRCLSSRNGSTIDQLSSAAAFFGLNTEVRELKFDELKNIKTPVIACWKRNRYVVIRGFKRGKVLLNDPAGGAYSVTDEKFESVFKNKILILQPTPNFKPEGQPVSIIKLLFKRISNFKKPTILTILFHSISIFMGLFVVMLSRSMLDDVVGDGQLELYLPILFGMGTTFIVRVIFSIIQTIYSYKVSRHMAAYSSSKFFKKLMSLPIKFFDQHYIGDIMERFDANKTLDHSLLKTVSPRFADVIMIVVYLILMFYYNSIIAAVCLVFEVIYIAASLMLQEKISTVSHSLNSSSSALRASQLNGLNTIDTIKSTGAERSFFSTWNASQAEYQKNSYSIFRVKTLSLVFSGWHATITSATLLFMGAYFIIQGNFTVGMLYSFQSVMSHVKHGLKKAIRTMNDLSSMRSNIERVDDILTRESVPEIPIQNNDELDKITGNIELENITYYYDRGDKPALTDINLSIKQGELVALVGPTGCGKSTIIKLIADLYKANSGTIKYNGRIRSEIPDIVFHSSIATVDQETMLFEDNISRNLKLWDDTIPDEDMIEAAKSSEIHDRIDSEPNGYKSPILENGRNYSSGEQQRMELARALVRKPTILLLDEFTSSLDAITEEKVFNSIKKQGITCILAAHRMSTVASCDRVIVIDKGKIVECGTHKQLYDAKGLYRKLMDKQ